MLPWKIQKIVQPENGILETCHYADLSRPLPDPPKGQTWAQNETTREWTLVPLISATADGDDNTRDPNSSAIADRVQYHRVLPTDTFQGLCLRYKVTPAELRRANRMMGTNLQLGPEKLIIPANGANAPAAVPGTPKEKVAALLSRVPMSVRSGLSAAEVRAYLEIADWDVDRAVKNVNEDFGS